MSLDWGGVWFAAWTTAKLLAWLTLMGYLALFMPASTGRRFRVAADHWPSRRALWSVVGFYLGATCLAIWWVRLASAFVMLGVNPGTVFFLLISLLLTAPAFFEAKRKPARTF